MEDTTPTPNRRENLRRSIMARRQARGRLSPVKVEQNWNRRSETTPADMEKKERRREQNRRAAQRCRTKKRLTQYNVIKNLEKIVEHNRTLQKEVQQLRWDKGELRRKWAAHRKMCPCFGSGADQQNLDTFESNMAIKTEPISDEEEEDSTDMKKLLDPEGQENEMEFSFASIASVLCSSPIAGFPKNFPEIANISDISDESLSAPLCSAMVSCSPSALGGVDSHYLPSPIKSKKDDKVIEQDHVATSQHPLSIATSQTPSSNLPTRCTAISSTSASSNITTSTYNNNEIRYNVSAPSGWQQSDKSPGHNQQNHSTYPPQSSCMYEGTIPQSQGYFTCQQQQMQQHMRIPQHLCPHSHQAYSAPQGISMGQGYHHTQYSENHTNNNNVFQISATLSMSTPSTNTAACASPSRQRCSALPGAQRPKSVQYPGLCRLLQPHPSPAQVVPSISTSSGDITGSSSPSSTFNGNHNSCLSTATTSVMPAMAAHQPNFLCNRPRSVLASGGSTPDTVRGATRDGYRGRCSSESSDASGYKVPSSAGETYFPRRSSETPEIDNDDVFPAAITALGTPASTNFNFDTNNNSAFVSNNNVHNSSNTVDDSNRASTSDVMLFNHESEAETSSVLEGVRHLIDCSGYSNGISSCSNTPNSISSNSSINSEVDDLLFEIPSDALLFFEANSDVDAPHNMFPESL